ncbi:uncharacterized protein [Venturia canescens]|uniref:uncharacterized protein n=1 Tax=Venturia canescens TaxID=32260 RepID=UPI001C9CA8FA|nr:uncharacterized protein LOC122414593 [Venturia canescens]
MADEALPTPTAVKERSGISVTPIMAKILEVILAIFIIGLIVDPLNSFRRIVNRPYLKLDDVAIIYITVAGYLIINTLFIISHALGDKIPKRMSIMFSSLGSLLHIVAGSVLVHNWRKRMNQFIDYQNNAIHMSKQYNDMLISASVFTFLNAAVFAFDIFLSMRYS